VGDRGDVSEMLFDESVAATLQHGSQAKNAFMVVVQKYKRLKGVV
jgi:hypothetical protein